MFAGHHTRLFDVEQWGQTAQAKRVKLMEDEGGSASPPLSEAGPYGGFSSLHLIAIVYARAVGLEIEVARSEAREG